MKLLNTHLLKSAILAVSLCMSCTLLATSANAAPQGDSILAPSVKLESVVNAVPSSIVCESESTDACSKHQSQFEKIMTKKAADARAGLELATYVLRIVLGILVVTIPAVYLYRVARMSWAKRKPKISKG